MQVRNIFNKGGQVVPYTIKWQKYLDADFTHNQNPFSIPLSNSHVLDGIMRQDESKFEECIRTPRHQYQE